MPSIPSSPNGPAITVRDATRADTSAFMDVIAHADPDDPNPFWPARAVLASRPAGPLSHGDNLCLLAEDNVGVLVGALLAGPPRWVLDHPGLAGQAQARKLLFSRVAVINGVAVHPGHRRQGIARAMLRSAEQRLTRAGRGLVTLDHSPALDGFYRRLGYSVNDALVVHVPGDRLLAIGDPNLRRSSKVLDRATRLADVPGLPYQVVTRLVPGAFLPDTGVVFDGRRLRY
ncbi:GNAT family N-acetyltransferase [Kitasatospora sp. NPDC085464]|uniref:GNAT family N-acetyltransferase n=1 Tax=Kitasatospora sp. NPDC085464 TaxID=3364063 RepID=UPI0037CAC47F